MMLIISAKSTFFVGTKLKQTIYNQHGNAVKIFHHSLPPSIQGSFASVREAQVA